MAEVTLSEAAVRFAATLKESERPAVLAEVSRFVRWYGADRPLGQLRGHDISLYADVLGPSARETTRRADHVRAFLTYMKKEGLLETSLAPHLRLRKANKTDAPRAAGAQQAVHLTRDGIEKLRAELESLVAQRPIIREEIRRAMLDKDFRENAPLDAAKEKQGHLEARIRELERVLKNAVLVEETEGNSRVQMGSSVVVRNIATGALVRYTIVGAAEASAADGKISAASPVGKALLDGAAGDEVEVSVPAGVLRLRIEEIAG